MASTLRVGRGLLDERLHRRRERVVGVLQQDVLARASTAKMSLGLGALDGATGRGGSRATNGGKRRSERSRSATRLSAGQVERRGQAVDLAVVRRRARGRAGPARGRPCPRRPRGAPAGRTGGGSAPSPARCRRFSASSSSTSRSSLRVTRKVKCSRTSMPGKSWSRWAAMTSSSGTNRVLYRSASGESSRPGRSTADEAGQQRRHLDPGEVLVAGLGVDQHDGEVEREARRCRGTGGPGRRPAG